MATYRYRGVVHSAQHRCHCYRYVEWEDRPERKRIASEILKTKKFTPIPGTRRTSCASRSRQDADLARPPPTEFQFVPLPKTNPILVGHRWKEYHEALGLKNIVDFSWETVQKEKPGMIHLLDFPYNGETPRPELVSGKITDNKWHL